MTTHPADIVMEARAGTDSLEISPPAAQPAASTGYLADAFDMFNVRDLDLIGQARSQCDRLILGVFTDDDAERLMGRRPIVPLEERVALLSHVRGVDTAVVHHESCSTVPAGALVFVATGLVGPGVGHAAVLSPRRETRGQVLRDALAPAQDQEAVA